MGPSDRSAIPAWRPGVLCRPGPAPRRRARSAEGWAGCTPKHCTKPARCASGTATGPSGSWPMRCCPIRRRSCSNAASRAPRWPACQNWRLRKYSASCCRDCGGSPRPGIRFRRCSRCVKPGPMSSRRRWPGCRPRRAWILVSSGPGWNCSGRCPRTADRHVLLGTDLHAQNILAASRKPWLAIDPKPYVGDPACEPLQYMINCRRLRSDPGELVNGWLACSDSAQSVSGCGRSRAASRSHPAARTWPASPPRLRLSEPAAAGQAGAGAPDQSWPPSLISGRTSTAP
jgi:hypothetical protein